MIPERAKALLSMMRYGDIPMAFRLPCDVSTKQPDPNGITEDEDREIKALWAKMPGNTAYIHALQRIACGQGT